MKQLWGFGGSVGGSIAALVCMTQTAWAAPSQIVEVRTSQTTGGLNVVLQTENGERPQVFAVNRGNTWVADVVNSNLNLPNGGAFRQDNPAPGIASVLVLPADANSVRVIVTGQGSVPEGKVASAVERGVVLNIAAKPNEGSAVGSETAAAPSRSQRSQTEVPPALQLSQSGQPLVPEPGVTIDGQPVPRPTMVPPSLPRAKAPPVGDIAISDLGVTPPSIDLGSAERVPRLVLREAPVREVLALLARAAGLNLAFTQGETDPAQQQTQDADAAFGGRITLDIENESVQDVFNYVLRLSGLQATRVGNTIFVSQRLPNSARDIVIRTFRLNQASAVEVSGYLVALGAESAVTETQSVPVVTQINIPGADPIVRTTVTQRTVVNTLRIDPEDSVPVLRGMQVLVDNRTNSLTLIGERRVVDLAATQLSRLDVRNRQVAVNVKIINVDLGNDSNWTASYTFGNNNSNAVVNNQLLGIQGLLYNFASPAFGGSNFGINLREFLGSLSASIQSGNSKILTDPTLVVQEGQSATVALEDQVISEVTATVSQVQGVGQTVTVDTTFEQVGLRLAVNVSRIDDNGFVTLNVSPEVRAPLPQVDLGQVQGINVFVTPISERSISSGEIRLRDGQTLVLTGIVQESEQSVVSKVPILGDLPILGALFRRSNNQSSRSEVIVLLTPQILDDSSGSTAFGYNYTPGSDVRNILQNNTVRTDN